MSNQDEMKAMYLLKEIVRAIRALEGLPVEYPLAKKLSDVLAIMPIEALKVTR